MNHTTDGLHGQVLRDVSATGHDRKWSERKMANEILAAAYDTVNPDKALRLRTCSTVLTFREFPDGQKHLEGMNSCRVRLCPICSWRRSLKCFYNTRRIMQQLDASGKYAYCFLTLTLRNCSGPELRSTLDNLFQSWNRFVGNKAFKKAVKGWYRGVEITHDTEEFLSADRVNRLSSYYKNRGLTAGDKNPNFDSFHPHVHIILVVNKSYFTSRDYLSKDRLAQMWKQAAQLDYTPIIDIRKVKGDTAKAVAEISKYAAKTTEYIVPDDWELTTRTVKILDEALANRRLIAYGGVMRETFKQLKLQDADSGDLIEVGEEKRAEEGKLVSYFWHSGYRQYISGAPNGA